MKNQRHLLFLSLVTLLLAMPQALRATDYFEDKYTSMCFMVTPNGQGCVHIKVLHLDQCTGNNGYIERNDDRPEGGWVYVMAAGESKRRYLVSLYNKNDRSDDNDDYIDVYMRFSEKGENGFSSNGVLYLTNPSSGGSTKMEYKNKSYRVKKPKGDARCFAEFDWYYPTELAGKELKFYITAAVSHGENLNDRQFSGSPQTATSVPDLSLSAPVFNPMGDNAGYYSLLVSNTTGEKLQIKQVSELDMTTGSINKDITSECKSSSDGFSLLIPSASYTRQVKVEAQVPYSKYIYYDMPAQTATLQALHNPKDFTFTADWGKKGSTVLKWTVPNAEQQDALLTDVFMVQRQLYHTTYGDSEEKVTPWETIDQVVMEQGKADYESVDSLTGCYGDSIHNSVRYRLYRVTLGNIEQYTKICTIRDKRAYISVGRFEPRAVTLTNGKVKLTWFPIGSENDGIKSFLPEGWSLTLLRTAHYYKNGIEINDATELNITDKFTYQNAEGLSEYIDEDFAPCTRYSYALVIYPNDPAGVMKRQEKPFTKDGKTVVVEPFTDDTQIGNFKASNDELQDRIHLQWGLDMKRIDKLTVQKQKNGQWEDLPIDTKLRYYDDFDVEAGQQVKYRLTITYECTDGVKTLVAEATGQRRASGKISGFVTFKDGTGLSNVEVRLTQGGKVIATQKTDAAGAYLFADVPYSDTYYQIQLKSDITEFDRVQIPVYVNKDKPFNYDKNFVSDGSFDVDGHVYFEQTTVPVYGATFKVDGKTVVDKSGNPVMSDNDGHFAFKVLKGTKRFEVVKEGHTFMYDGLYADNKGNAITINEPRANIFFWDQTKVRTIGRVVGGLDQGDKPLGFGLSENNLGDDLRIVLELDGNQRSWLVKDQLNDALTTRYDTLTFEATQEKLTSTVITERHRIVISPNAETGEYIADLLPTRYKVVEVSAKGYPSLFQKGKVGEVLDLTDSLTTKNVTNEDTTVNYNAIYNRIFRVEPSVTITEQDINTGALLSNVGLATYTEMADDGKTPVEVPIYDAKTKTYTFGYPVLTVGKHDFRIAATENYYYNGVQTGRCDSVPLRGGQVRVYDDFAAVQHDTLCVLNTQTGETTISVDVQNTVYDVQGTNALRHIDATLEHEGQFIDGKSLRAFVMGNKQITDDVMSADGVIELVDVIRDPQGSRSYAWVDTETVYNSQFHCDIGIDFGLKLGYETGTRSDVVSGVFAGAPGGTFAGTTTAATTTFAVGPTTVPIIGLHYTHNGSVTFQLNERIQTSNDPAFVGAKGDVYCGYELVAASSFVRNVRAINEPTYLYLKEAGLFSEEDGACHLIAEGKTTGGIPYYLISDYAHQMGPKVKSTFTYTQDYILNTLLPKLRTARNAYLYKGTREQAQAQANATLRNVFFSLRDEDDPRYGQDNRDDEFDYISIDRYDELYDKLNYEVITPEYVKILKLEKQLAVEASATDSVRIMNRQISQWEYIVAVNELEKVEAFKAIDNDASKRSKEDYDPGTPYKVKDKNYYAENHSVSGGTSYTHAESFSYKDKSDLKVPVLGYDVTDFSDEQNMNYLNKVINGAINVGEGAAESKLSDKMKNVAKDKGWSTSSPEVKVTYNKKPVPAGQDPDPNGFDDDPQYNQRAQILRGKDLQNAAKLKSIMDKGTEVSVKAASTYTRMTIVPDFDVTYDVNNDESTSTTIYRGYELATDADSHLSIDVYHDVQTVTTGVNVVGVGSSERTLSKGNYIFRAIGGATKCPHDDGEVTQMYLPGTPISQPTAYVEKPRITVENHIISNVPYGETAKFNLVLSNEGTVRQEGSFDLVLIDKTNQVGASLIMDGAPLGNGRSIVVPFGTGMVKVLEIGQGMVDDYENIRLALRSQCDPSVADTVSLSVHFVPSASPIAVITPQDKWVLNTNSAQDERGRYYMPVTIGGYDVNFRNFDHVELQYKQSREPESRWTNLCSYYNVDSLYQKGVGTKAMLTGGTLTHAFYGDSDPVELKYDLRAVTYSRLGNDFVTQASPVFSGIKDTRRPQLFGSPQPADGILGVGEDLKLIFSENIDANRLLTTNNFKVTGLPNNSAIATTTYLYMPGDYEAYLETEQNYSAPDESFTVDMMLKADAVNKSNCTLFEHNYDNYGYTGFSIGLNYINNSTVPMLVVTAKENIREQQNISAKLDDLSTDFQRIVVVYDKDARNISIYQNNELKVQSELVKQVTGIKRSGKMVFGRKFAGNLLEARVWSKALTKEEIEKTAGKVQYGSEVDLAAYYPMNEGYGTSLRDMAQNNSLVMKNAKWVTLDGTSLRLNGMAFKHELNREMFEKTSLEKSYTLGLWFKASQKDANASYPIMASGYGVKGEAKASEKLFIGVKSGKMTISCDTTSIVMNKGYADDEWHQLTFVVDRSTNIASSYVDGELTGQAEASGFGQLYGDAPFYLGQLDVKPQLELLGYMEGFIDEIVLWDMALPRNVVKQRMNESHDGTEPGLLAYIPFSENVRQITGGGTKAEFSTKYYYNKWDTEQQKYVCGSESAFSNSTDISKVKASQQGVENAPVRAKGVERDLRFDFITKDNELIIALKEPAKDIDRTTVNITAMGIEDMNGNEMAQPVTWSAFIDCNSVRWADSYQLIDINADTKEDYTFTVEINNLSGARRDYTIEGLADWMTVEEGTMGTLDPEEKRTLHITISKDINIGTYDDVLYLRNDEELVNPLALTIKKVGNAPEWTFNKNAMRNMQVVAEVKKGDLVVNDKESLVGAFDEYDKCLGTAHVDTDQNGKAIFYMVIYGEKKDAEVFFRLWDATSGITYGLTPERAITYIPDSIVASYEKPIVMTANSNIARELELIPTWTWVSFNVASPKAGDMNQLMKRGSWTNGDQLRDLEEQTYYTYNKGVWNSSKAGAVMDSLRCDRMYYIKSQMLQTVTIEGSALVHESQRTIKLHPKWNYIGYTPLVNLPVNEALEDLNGKLSDGDIIKSQDEFATYSVAGGGWRGNLRYMKPGKGYMLYHKVTAEHPKENIEFVYPFKSTLAVAAEAKGRVDVVEDEPLWMNTRLTTMNMIVRTEGVNAEEGDRILAYADGELCGIAEAMNVDGEPLFFLSVGGESKKELTFTLERDGECLGAATRAGIVYQADTLEGTTDMPKVIDFSDATTYETGIWYTLTGIRLGEDKPAVPGVYIFNGQRVTIR